LVFTQKYILFAGKRDLVAKISQPDYMCGVFGEI